MATKKSASKTSAKAAVTVTPVRNSAVPPKSAATPVAKKLVPTAGQIALRAYEIWQSGKGGSQDDNWFKAERDLRAV